MSPFELYLFKRATAAEAENEKLWMELEKFLVVKPPSSDEVGDVAAAVARQAAPEDVPPTPPVATPREPTDAELERNRQAAEAARAKLNYKRQMEAQEALLARQEEDDMYAYLKKTPTLATVKDNFVLPNAEAANEILKPKR